MVIEQAPQCGSARLAATGVTHQGGELLQNTYNPALGIAGRYTGMKIACQDNCLSDRKSERDIYRL